jgi:hypothetical protein
MAAAPTVAVLNASDDTVEMLETLRVMRACAHSQIPDVSPR